MRTQGYYVLHMLWCRAPTCGGADLALYKKKVVTLTKIIVCTQKLCLDKVCRETQLTSIISYPSEAILPCCNPDNSQKHKVHEMTCKVWSKRWNTKIIHCSNRQLKRTCAYELKLHCLKYFSVSVHSEGFGKKWPLCLERNLTLTSPKESGWLLPVLKEQIRMNLNEMASKTSSQVSYNISATTSQLGLPWGLNTVC